MISDTKSSLKGAKLLDAEDLNCCKATVGFGLKSGP